MPIPLFAAFDVQALVQNPGAWILGIAVAAWFMSQQPDAPAKVDANGIAAPPVAMPVLNVAPVGKLPTTSDGMQAVETLAKLMRARGVPDAEISAFVTQQLSALISRAQ